MTAKSMLLKRPVLRFTAALFFLVKLFSSHIYCIQNFICFSVVFWIVSLCSWGLSLLRYSSSIQFQPGFLVTEGGRIHLVPSVILSHLPSISFDLQLPRSLKTFFTLSSTCLLHVIFGRPRFRFEFTSIIIAFISILSSSLLITCPYHLTLFAFCHFIQRFLRRPTQHLHQVLHFLSIH